jgi:septal ring factor EnvC (AmiA/AmiB activator)
MHSEHKQWESDIAMWKDDARMWQKELKQVQSELKELKERLSDHRKGLAEHVKALRKHARTSGGHEHALAEYETGGEGEDLIALAKSHGQEIDRHALVRDAHERIKKYHHTVLAEWSHFFKSLAEPVY